MADFFTTDATHGLLDETRANDLLVTPAREMSVAAQVATSTRCVAVQCWFLA